MTFTLESVAAPAGLTEIDEDEAPDIDSPGYDAEAPYGRTATGRIRKRPVGSATRGTGTTPIRNEKKARQATAALIQLNGFAVIGCMTAGMAETAGKLMSREEKLSDDIYNALVLDPNLCDYILKVGVKSGKVMLIVAFAVHLASIAPTAITEYREREAA